MVPTPRNSDGGESNLSTNSLFEALTDGHRRAMLVFLGDTPEEEVASEEVVEFIHQHGSAGSDLETLDLLCHHSHFPKLDEAGLVSHDAENKTITILRKDTIAQLRDIINELEER